jgi:hypothetical protein
MRRVPFLACWFSLLLASATAAQAGRPALTVDLHNGGRPMLQLDRFLDDAKLEEAVASGIPIRIRIRVELWRDRFFDELKQSEIWNAVLAYLPLEKSFVLRTRGSPSTERRLSSYGAARVALESARTFALRPTSPGRYYYTANVQLETLSLSDLEELERWLQGELKPAVTGERSVPEAIGEGAKRLFIRVLALPTRTLELRTDRFSHKKTEEN